MQTRQENTKISLTRLPSLLLISAVYFFMLFLILQGVAILAINAWGATGQIVFYGFLLLSAMTTQILKLFLQQRLGVTNRAKIYMWAIILAGGTVAAGLYFLMNIDEVLRHSIK